MADYDFIVIGGGLGGAVFGRAMAEQGARVLVLERDPTFRDRVRGEGLVPWGVREAEELGVLDLLCSSCAHTVAWWDIVLNGTKIVHRPIAATTPAGRPLLTFFHPAMQETLLAAAADAGAEVRRGVRARAVTPGVPVRVAFQEDVRVEERTASLAVGADGRDSLVRRAAGFDVQRNPKRLRVSGVLLEGLVDAPSDTSTLAFDIDIGHQAVLFPLGGGRARTYVMTRHEEDIHLQGEKDVDRLRDLAIRAGLPAACLAGARAAGPLASFDGAASWVERPYQDGVALVGDAAGTSDPSWGQGLSLALRSARQLRDAVLAHEDRETAGEVYAAAQHGSFGRMLSVERIYERMLTERGQEADAKRAQALPLLAQDPTVMPDHLLVGPDLALEGPLAQIYAT